MGIELIILIILLLLGGFIWLGYIGRKKRKKNDNSGPKQGGPEQGNVGKTGNP